MSPGAGGARQLLGAAERVVVLTGAGISTDSGIRDFRGPHGLWTKDPAAERLSTLDTYLSSSEVRQRSWRGLVASKALQARPNAAHRLLVAFERLGTLQLLVTQNTDGLHLDAGQDPDKLVEIHGSNRLTRCLRCGWIEPTVDVLRRVEAGDDDPHCLRPVPAGAVPGTAVPGATVSSSAVPGTAVPGATAAACAGVLKRTTVLFGEQLEPGHVARAARAVERCDVLLCIGSTLAVYPAASLVPLGRRAGAAVVILNGSPTAQDELAHVVVRGPIGELLPAVLPL
jgi:NAD-dependent deacetylase